MQDTFIPSIKLDSNVVQKESLRAVQLNVLKQLREIMANTFGPAGSNTLMLKGSDSNSLVSGYSKDGHTVLKNVLYSNPIEMSIQSELTGITQYVERKVGDGTTSAVELSSFVFEKMCEIEESHNPYQMKRDFNTAVENIKAEIKTHRRDITLEDIYNIALISTNGNMNIAEELTKLYEQHGFDVFIDVKVSTNENSYGKTYDGLTFQEGYCSRSFVNNNKGTCKLNKPKIYAFADPIDTPEMITLFTSIIYNNIMIPTQMGAPAVPTLIMSPKISRDVQPLMTQLDEMLYSFDSQGILEAKPQLCIVTNFGSAEDLDQYTDIAMICGAPMIRKYIDPKIQEKDIEDGKAPTKDTVCNFFGTAEEVDVDNSKTKFVNPKHMHDENDPEKFGAVYNSILAFTEAELKSCQESGEDAATTGRLKRKLNSLKANMVDYFVGGISVSDRDELRALVEDAVLNCRSASTNGVGYAANFEGYRAVLDLKKRTDVNDPLYKYYSIIAAAYREVSILLYSTIYRKEECDKIIAEGFEKGCPMNLTTAEYDHKVLCSIDTDVIILDAISRIVTIMFTANQALVQSPSCNIY